jgi:hypothetical protein
MLLLWLLQRTGVDVLRLLVVRHVAVWVASSRVRHLSVFHGLAGFPSYVPPEGRQGIQAIRPSQPTRRIADGVLLLLLMPMPLAGCHTRFADRTEGPGARLDGVSHLWVASEEVERGRQNWMPTGRVSICVG